MKNREKNDRSPDLHTWLELALFLALALLLQSLRLLFPMLPPPVNMFFIGSLLNAVMILAIWRTNSLWALVIGLFLPVGAFFQGQMPVVLMVPVIGLGNIFLMVWCRYFRQGGKLLLAPFGKAAILYGGTSFLLHFLYLPPVMISVLTFMMIWPQIVTGLAGIFIARVCQKHLYVR